MFLYWLRHPILYCRVKRAAKTIAEAYGPMLMQPARDYLKLNRESYGRSPAMDALPDMKAIAALPPEERARANAVFARGNRTKRMGQ
jgi:Bacteriophage head to tail connecting protein